mmetsp:Transcript_30290/g.50329  ORF Transcript_30290/g.50329 Transcript_30290/m.50329 type:complete len:85 (-) Transcript_30290:239-493(-)
MSLSSYSTVPSIRFLVVFIAMVVANGASLSHSSCPRSKTNRCVSPTQTATARRIRASYWTVALLQREFQKASFSSFVVFSFVAL